VKVAALSSYGVLGGAELSLATFLEYRPDHVDAVALLMDGGPLAARLAGLAVPVHSARGYTGRPTLTRAVRFARELSGFLERERPDVVWALGQKAALLAVAPCRRRRIPLVWHKVDFSWDRLLAAPLAEGVNGVVCVSQAVAGALGPLGRRKMLGVVDPPLRLSESLRAEPDRERPVIGTLARLVPYKGHHHILAAAAELSAEFPGLRVVLAGGPVREFPDYPRELERQAAELGLDGRVELPGFVNDVEAVLRRLSVFVNATYRDEEGFGLEGLSGAMLEASWAGVPVVATGGGGTAEGLVDGETGTLVPEAEPHAIAAAVAPYLRDPELAERTGAAGMALARARCAPGPASRRLFDLLALAAGGPGGPR
jgi:glycosyltransferase involved in cell wall biosynthesis